MTKNRTKVWRVVLALAGATTIGGCASQIMDLSADELQSRSKDASGSYLPVNDLPAPSQAPTAEQRAKMEAELKAARDHQEALAKQADRDTSNKK